MQILDNVRNTVKDDLQVTIKKGSKISVFALFLLHQPS